MDNSVFFWVRSALITISFFLLCLLVPLIFVLRSRFCCNCEICHDYLTSNWTKKFDNISDWYSHLLQKSATGTFHIHILGNTVTANPLNVEYMLKKKFENFPKGKRFSAILGDLLGRGIFNVDGETWRFQRKMASLELGSVSVRSFAFPVIKAGIENRLLPIIASTSDDLDLQDIFRRYAFDTVCKISFGFDPCSLEASLPSSEFARAFDTASEISAKRAITVSPLIWRIKRLLNIGSEKKLRNAINFINLQAESVIKRKRHAGISNQHDLLSRFMALVDDDEYLRDIVKSFLLAGRDTVASALTSCFYLLSTNKAVLAALRDEIDQVMNKQEEVPSFEQMREMHYLNAVLHESMRLYPPIQFDSKFPVSDDLLPDGTEVKKGTRVTYHPYAMGRMKKSWGEDCLEFKPERWLKNGVFRPENPFKYPVFQAGMRICLGKEMAILQMKAVIASVFRQFEVEIADPSGNKPRFSPGLTASLKDGLKVRIKCRTSYV